MPTKNERKARQGTASRKSNSFSLVKEDIESLMRDNFDNSLKDIGTFKGTILSIESKLLVENEAGKETSTIKDGNQPANFYEILVRPEWFKSPAPWTFEDFTVEDDVINFGENSAAARDAHPMARSNDVLGKGQTTLLQIGQIVICTFGDGVDNQGRFRDIRFDLNSTGRMNEEMQITLEHRGSSAAFGNGSAGLLGGSSTPTTSIPVLKGDIKPIRTWVATPSVSRKEDSAFQKGKCPKALGNSFKALPRKVTTFYTYEKEQVVKAITRSGQPDYVQRTMYAYIRKEQPRFSFPNNNVAGIQTDGGMFRGTTITDYDYHTCFKDAVTWRAFAGFNSLERGMKTFGITIANKYSSIFKKPSGNYQEQAETLVWNYYRGWNLALKPDELDTLKATGQVTRKGKVYKKGWSKNVKYFAKEMESFDSAVASMGA
tara:strand:- start:2911 stop:4203 length:1293 start_codon:yes stop_codon:yes gene_type:complete